MASVHQVEYHAPSLHLPGQGVKNKCCLRLTWGPHGNCVPWLKCNLKVCSYLHSDTRLLFIVDALVQNMIALYSGWPALKQAWVTFFAGILTKKKANPQNWYRTDRKNNLEGRCWIKAWRLSAEQEAEKLPASIPQQSWIDSGENASTFWLANLWKDYHLTNQFTQYSKKGHPFNQTSFPIWTPPWSTACSRVCEGGNVGNRNCDLGLVDLHLVITSWHASPQKRLHSYVYDVFTQI